MSCGSLRFDFSGGRVDAPRVVGCDRTCRGRRAGHRHIGVPQERGSPCRLQGKPGWRYRVNNSRPGVAALSRAGSETRVQPWYRLCEGKRSTAGRAAGSRSALIVPWKQGNSSRGNPGEGSEASSHRTVGGKHGEDPETRHRVNATTTDRRAGEAIPADGIHFPGPPHRPRR